MKTNYTVSTITILVALIFAGLIVAWHFYTPSQTFAIQAPGADNRPAGLTRAANDVRIGEYFMQYATETSSLTGKWANFRGESHDNIARTSENIRVSGDAYPELWRFETGEGHAAPVIYNGMVYVLDYDEKINSDALRCFSLESGNELWRRWYRVPIKRNHGFSRTIPVVRDGFIITIGPQGHVMCCDPLTGDMKWSLDMQKTFETEVPFWYTGQCPLVDGNTLILAPGGKEILMTGLDCLTGKMIWETPNTPQLKMSHSSVMPMSLGGKKMFVYAGIGGICGVSAEPNDLGTLLWHTDKWQPSVLAPSPVKLNNTSLLCVAGYGNGGMRLNVTNNGGTWSATVVDQYRSNLGLACEQQTPIAYNGMVITIIPKDGGGLRDRLVLYNADDLRNAVWSSGADERFGLGPYMIINQHLFALKDDGELYVYSIQKAGMILVKKQRIIDGVDAWGPLAYADGRLIVRDAHTVICLKINE